MKLKNINTFEQHIEKLVVGLVLLCLLAVGFLYYVRDPYTVTLEPGRGVKKPFAPDEINELLVRESNKLSDVMDTDKVPDVLNVEQADYEGSFRQRHEEQLMTIAMLTPWNDVTLLGTGDDVVAPAPEFVVPKPVILAMELGIDSLADYFRQRHPDIIPAGIRDDEPVDLQWMSLISQFPMDKWREELGKEDNADFFWLKRAADQAVIVDVQLQRQMRLPDGTWSEPELVGPMPGQDSLRQYLANINPENAKGVIGIAREKPLDIIQPQFPELKGIVWQPPAIEETPEDDEGETALAATDDGGKIEKLEKRIKNLERRIRRDQGELQRRQGTQRTIRGGAGFMGPGAMGGAGDQPGGRTRKKSKAQEERERRKADRQRQIVEKKRTDIAKWEAQLQQLQQKVYDLMTPEAPTAGQPGVRPRNMPTRPTPGARSPGGAYGGMPGGMYGGMPGGMYGGMPGGMYGGMPGGMYGGMPGGMYGGAPNPYAGRSIGRRAPAQPGPGQPAARPGAQTGPYVGDVDSDKPDMFASDLFLEPGRTYRYRIRVAVNNPLYNQQDLAPEDVKKNANRFVLYSDWSDWTDPITSEKLLDFFLTDSNKSPDPGRASVVIMRYYDGQWREGEFEVRPGDPIGSPMGVTIDGRKTNMDFFTGAIAIDLEFDHVVYDSGGRTRKTTQMLYLQDDQLKPRIERDDKNDKRLQKLQKKARDAERRVAGFNDQTDGRG